MTIFAGLIDIVYGPAPVADLPSVAHARSFSRAAEGLSLPSLRSPTVALLETEIGVRLLDRGRGGLRLTRPARSCSNTPTTSRGAWSWPTRRSRPWGSASREPAPRGVPDCPARLRPVRDRPAPTRARRPSCPAQRGHAEHPRTALPRGELDVAISYQDATATPVRARRRGADRPDAGHLPRRLATEHAWPGPTLRSP